MANLTQEQANDLSAYFQDLSATIGSFREDNAATLAPADNDKLNDIEWQLADYSDEMAAQSVALVFNGDAQAAISQLNTVTGEIKTTLHGLRNLQNAIDVAAGIVTLGKAIVDKDPGEISTALTALYNCWTKAKKEG